MHRLTVFCFLALAPLAAAAPDERRDDRRDDRRGGDEVDRLSRRLERDAHELREELLVPFREREPHRDLEKHVREIERLAGRLREGDRKERARHLRETLDKIDEEVREVERNLRELGRIRDIDRRAFDRVRDDLSDMTRILYRLRREL